MIRKILCRILLLLIPAIIFYSCKKEQSSSQNKNYSVRLIPPALARSVAERVSVDFLQNTNPDNLNKLNGSTTGIPNRIIVDSIFVYDQYGIPALYIYNYAKDSGFVVISADARLEPICAYVESGKFQADTVPATLVEWFDATVENIEMVRTGAYDNSARANYAWWDLLQQTDLSALNEVLKPMPIDPPPPGCDDGWIVTVRGPLLQTTWGQSCTYNEQCPNSGCNNVCWTNQNTWTGCVATAMSQVLRYWSHPNHFGYNYATMPNAQGNGEVQRMMRDAGNSVDMSYGCSSSGAQDYKVDDALKSTFNFSSADGPSFLNQSNYNSGSYLTVVSNLNNNWPVILGGYSKRKNVFLGIIHIPQEGHSWVCDGYWSSQNYCYSYLRFHMNWGWHEAFGGNDFNGWYAFNVWNPGTRNFQYARSYIYNIHP